MSITIVIFVACGFGAFAIFMVLNDVFLREEKKLEGRLDEFRSKQRERAKKTSLFKDMGKVMEEATEGQESFYTKYQTMLEQGGLDEMTVEKAMMIHFAAAVALGLLLYLPFDFYGAGAGALVGGILPYLVFNYLRNDRLNKLRTQLPDVFDLMARIIRAGQTMPQAMQAVSDEFVPPISVEFTLCTEMMNLGISPEAALQDMARRSGIIEIKIFVLGLLIQRETGGNLAEMLDNLSKTIRRRFKINGQIQTLTAEGRMQAAVLMCLPPGMMGIMFVMNRDYIIEIFDTPELILIMFVSMFLGWLWIRKIVNFDY